MTPTEVAPLAVAGVSESLLACAVAVVFVAAACIGSAVAVSHVNTAVKVTSMLRSQRAPYPVGDPRTYSDSVTGHTFDLHAVNSLSMWDDRGSTSPT